MPQLGVSLLKRKLQHAATKAQCSPPKFFLVEGPTPPCSFLYRMSLWVCVQWVEGWLPNWDCLRWDKKNQHKRVGSRLPSITSSFFQLIRRWGAQLSRCSRPDSGNRDMDKKDTQECVRGWTLFWCLQISFPQSHNRVTMTESPLCSSNSPFLLQFRSALPALYICPGEELGSESGGKPWTGAPSLPYGLVFTKFSTFGSYL